LKRVAVPKFICRRVKNSEKQSFAIKS